jgi:hypothetical protein
MAVNDYNTLTTTVNVETLKLLFPDIISFVRDHVFLFIENQPHIVFGVQSGLTVAQIIAIRTMKANIEEQERAAKLDPHQLTGSHRQY